MNRSVLVIVLALALLVGGGFAYLLMTGPAPGPDLSRGETPSAVAATPPTAARDPEPRAPASPARDSRASSAPTIPPPAIAPSMGTLNIDSDVPGSLVFIDRQLVGRSPVTATNIAPGTHQLNVQADGFEGIAETIVVTAGSRDLQVRLREVKLDASIAVVHKHGIGSCTGQLIATPQGIRYDTTDREDAFSAPLDSLEAFDVAYLEKNLRVKLSGGKQYNFTDPEGNADRLFVFHRDVAKTRERLAKGDTPAN